MAEQMSDNDVKKMLELLKEQTNEVSEDTVETAKRKKAPSDDDIKAMLRKHYSAEDTERDFDKDDYSIEGLEEFIPEEEAYETVEEAEVIEEAFEEAEEEIIEETEAVEEAEVIEETEKFEESTDDSEGIDKLAQAIEKAEPDYVAEESEEEFDSEFLEQITIDDVTSQASAEDEEEQEEEEDEPEVKPSIFSEYRQEKEEESIEAAVEPEATESVEDMLKELKEEAGYGEEEEETVDALEEQGVAEEEENVIEDGFNVDFQIPTPTEEFLAIEDENEKKIDNSIYFKTDDAEGEELDATDITLMMALDSDGDLSETMGFERIRRAVNDFSEESDEQLDGKEIYACDGEEFKKEEQIPAILNRYEKEKSRLMLQICATAFFSFVLFVYELLGSIGVGILGIFDPAKHRIVHIVTAMILSLLCAAISYEKITKSFRSIYNFSSGTCFTAIVLLALNVINDICLLGVGSVGSDIRIFHTFAALLFLISLIYDMLNLVSQKSTFDIISTSGRKLVIEPYGRFKLNDKELIPEDSVSSKGSYCIEKASFAGKYFARTAKISMQEEKQIISLAVGFVLSFLVMLLLILFGKPFSSVLSGFMLTASFVFSATAVFKCDYAFRLAGKLLSKLKTAIIGKASLKEYSGCDLIYFDDTDVFDKNSVRTKGLKLYDNNEIYRVLYNTQAVFSKIGGPLKPVFDFATTEMGHSKNVTVKMISSEGVLATVDENTTVCMGTDSFMKSNKIYPKRLASDDRAEDSGEESIMYIALNGVLCAKLYASYKLSRKFEKTLKQLHRYSVNVGIRSSDPNINKRWANALSKNKGYSVSVVKPTVKELEPFARRSDSGIVSLDSARSAAKGLIMCLKLSEFERRIDFIKYAAIVIGAIVSFLVAFFSGPGVVAILLLVLYEMLCIALLWLFTHMYLKNS